jgi:hypothetical protein
VIWRAGPSSSRDHRILCCQLPGPVSWGQWHSLKEIGHSFKEM